MAPAAAEGVPSLAARSLVTTPLSGLGARKLSLLVADEDIETLAGVIDGLEARGVDVTACTDGAETLLRMGRDRPDVVLVSARLPVVPGALLVDVVRRCDSTPIIFGVGAADAAAAAHALAAGANVCVARPYRLHELLSILRAARPGLINEEPARAVLEVGPVRMDLLGYDVFVRGRQVRLALREFELLRFFLQHPDRAVTRDEISAAVWGGQGSRTNTIIVHIRRLRAKLGDDLKNPRLIRTIRGIGYTFSTTGFD